MEDENINKAKNVLEEISQDERERRLTELREKYRMDQHAIMLAGYDKGLRDGIEQGIEQNRKDILEKLLKTKLSIEEIIAITGFTEEEIKKLKK